MITYLIKCDHCGYRLGFSYGILMNFQRTNAKLFEKMKQGEFGEEFKKIASKNSKAQAYHSSELFRCPKCGELEGGKIIGLDDRRNRIRIETPHNCKKCNTKMEVLDGFIRYSQYELICPCCKEKLCSPIPISFAD